MSRQHIHIPTNLLDAATDRLTAFAGSFLFLGIHIAWFTLWIAFRLEPFPFGLLTMIVSLEAIFLSTLVMMSQNRQGTKDRKRDDLESDEVQSMFDNHMLLMQINQQQLSLLEKQTEMLTMVQGLLTLLQEQNKSRRSKRIAPNPVVEEPA